MSESAGTFRCPGELEQHLHRLEQQGAPRGEVPALLTPRAQALPHPVTYDQEIIACTAPGLAERLPYRMMHNSGETDETTEQCVFTETDASQNRQAWLGQTAIWCLECMLPLAQLAIN